MRGQVRSGPSQPQTVAAVIVKAAVPHCNPQIREDDVPGGVQTGGAVRHSSFPTLTSYRIHRVS